MKTTNNQSEFLEANLDALRSSNSFLSTLLEQHANSVTPTATMNDASSRIASQLQQNSVDLMNFSKPVLIIGLHPGDELLYIFNLSMNQKHVQGRQHIYVCIHSLPSLLGFMKEFNATEILTSDRVHFFWHENTDMAIKDLRNHPERIHIPTVISGSQNGIVTKTLQPFIKYSKELAAETKRLQDANNAYYDSIDDIQLATIIEQNADNHKSQARAPRLMLLTIRSSSVTQFSARDTAIAFKKIGWDTQHLNVESNLTTYYMAKKINEYKPDIFLFINHLRTEATIAYPDNMMFITWIQDTIPSINNKITAEDWNKMAGGNAERGRGNAEEGEERKRTVETDKTILSAVTAKSEKKPTHQSPSSELRVPSSALLPPSSPNHSAKEIILPIPSHHPDQNHSDNPTAPLSPSALHRRDLIIGYTDQLKKYGYLEDRLHPMPMIVDTNVFKPRKLTPEQKAKYQCDICFASNRSKPTDQIVKEELTPLLAPHGFTEEILMTMHDHLWEEYRAEEKFTTYQDLQKELLTIPQFLKIHNTLTKENSDKVIQILFWHLNDPIYRHIVLEWLDDLITFERGTGNAEINNTAKPPSLSANLGSQASSSVPRSAFPSITMHLYGTGWENHPRFAKYAKGEIAHGKTLSMAYQSAKYCLHLNSIEGAHQRISEIHACGAKLLTRRTNTEPNIHFNSALRKLAANPFSSTNNVFENNMSKKEQEAVCNWVFDVAYSAASETVNTEHTDRQYIPIKEQIMTMLDQEKTHYTSNILEFSEYSSFDDRKSLDSLMAASKMLNVQMKETLTVANAENDFYKKEGYITR